MARACRRGRRGGRRGEAEAARGRRRPPVVDLLARLGCVAAGMPAAARAVEQRAADAVEVRRRCEVHRRLVLHSSSSSSSPRSSSSPSSHSSLVGRRPPARGGLRRRAPHPCPGRRRRSGEEPTSLAPPPVDPVGRCPGRVKRGWGWDDEWVPCG
jgi:hypothetical protein